MITLAKGTIVINGVEYTSESYKEYYESLGGLDKLVIQEKKIKFIQSYVTKMSPKMWSFIHTQGYKNFGSIKNNLLTDIKLIDEDLIITIEYFEEEINQDTESLFNESEILYRRWHFNERKKLDIIGNPLDWYYPDEAREEWFASEAGQAFIEDALKHNILKDE